MRSPTRVDSLSDNHLLPPDGTARAGGSRIIWLATGMLLVSACAVAAGLYYMRQEALRTGERLNQSLAHVIEEQTSRTLQTTDQRLLLALSQLKTLRAARTLNEASARELLRDQIRDLPFVRAIWVLDAQGLIQYDSDEGNIGLPLQDREYFQAYRNRPGLGLHVSAPVRSRTTGSWLTTASRPIRGADGALEGVIAAAVEAPYFEQLWRGIDLGAEGAVALFRRDGVLMMRSPHDEQSVGKVFTSLPLFTEHLERGPTGTYATRSTFDGIDRISSYRTLAYYPELIVVVGRTRQALLGPWQRFAMLASLLWLGAVVSLALVLALLYRQLLRRRNSELLFRQLAQAMPQIVFMTDRAGQVVFFNAQWTEITGQPAELALGRGWADWIHPDDREPTREAMGRMLAAGTPMAHEHRLRGKDNQYRWRLVRAMPNRDAAGRIVSWFGTSTDVHELKQALAELRAKADMLRMAGQVSRVAAWAVDVPTRRMVWTDEALQILGLDPALSPTLDAALRQCVPPGRELAERAAAACITEGTPVNVEVEFASPSGTRVWIHSIGYAVRDTDGTIVRIEGAFQDITARVRAERALQAWLQTLQRTAEAAQAIARQRSVDAMLAESARQAQAIIGAGHATASLGPRTHVAGAGEMAVPLTLPDPGNAGTLVLANKHHGDFTPQDMYVANQLAQFTSIAIDNARLLARVQELNSGLEEKIAERAAQLARQEALFRALAEQAPQPIWTVDPRGQATFFSRAWYELFGGGPPDWQGDAWVALVHPDDLAPMRQNWEQSVRSGTDYAGTRRLRGRDGTYHTTTYRATPVRDDQGGIQFWVGIDVDITEIKAIEAALRSSNAELEAFSYSVSHDLRAPLRSVDGYSRLLAKELEGPRNPKVEHYLARIQAGAHQMGQLIDGLLTLAQVARMELQHDRIDLSAMASETLAHLQAVHPGQPVHCRIEPGLEAQGDSRLIRSVMDNLLGNAWKFSGRKAQPLIEVGRDAESGAFFVRDNGSGFDMAYADKLFGTFQRLHAAQEFPGSGIGLATAARIIKRHGGRIWAESAPEQGATFYFTLPAAGT